jgi:histidinol-phosphate aminotransferase
MAITRRNILSRLATAAASAAGLQALDRLSLAQTSSAETNNILPGVIRLSQNENAYGPSEKVLAAMREASPEGNRYPGTEYDSLISKIARLHRVRPEQIVLGCGSSEVLRLVAEEFLGPAKRFLQASPTFPLAGHFAQSVGAEVVSVPLNKMYEHDLETILARSGASTGLVYICNPNNPTSTLTPRRDIEAFISKLPGKTMVLIDEAYHHFAGETSAYASFLDRPVGDPRVMVTRTFSKIYGLAGMRVGYLVAAPEIASRLSARRLMFGVGVVSAQSAGAALDDSEYVALAVRRNARDRQEFMNQVNARMMRALDSHTNFVMLNPGRPAHEVFEHLNKNNILVAPPVPQMNQYIRVSLGIPAEMRQFWRVIDLMPGPKMVM